MYTILPGLKKRDPQAINKDSSLRTSVEGKKKTPSQYFGVQF